MVPVIPLPGKIAYYFLVVLCKQRLLLAIRHVIYFILFLKYYHSYGVGTLVCPKKFKNL